MSKFESSAVAYTQQFQVFDQPILEKSVSSSEYVPYYPNGSLSDSGVLEFAIQANNVHFIDLSSCYVHTVGRVIKKNKANLAAADVVAPVNGFASALYSQVECYINDILVSDPAYYPYKAMIDSLLYYNERDRKSLLRAGMYIKDDNAEIDVAKNSGFKTRVDLVKGSKTWEIITPIHDGLFRVGKFLPSFVNVRIKLRRSSPSFALVSSVSTAADDDYSIVFDEVIFYCKKILPYPEINELFTREIQKGLLPYFPYDKAEIKNFSISKGSLSIVSDTLFSGYLPSFIVVMLVETTAVNGSIKKNSFDFVHNNLSSISAVIDSETNTQRVVNVDFEKGKVLHAYLPFLEKLTERDCNNFLSLSDYKLNTSLFVFNISPLKIPGYLHPSKQGSLKLDLKFSAGIEEALTVLTYANFQNIITFDPSRNVNVEQI